MQLKSEKVHLDKADWIEFSPLLWSPENGNERLAALVGYMTGDGTVARRTQRYTRKDGELSVYENALQSAFYSNDQNDLQLVLSDCRSLGAATAATVKPKKVKEGYDQGYQLQLGSADTQMLIDAGTPIGSKTAQEFDVPEWIKSGDKGVKRAYLAALFGAEGTAPTVDRSSKARTPRSPTLNMCKKPGYSADAFFASLADMVRDLGVDCATSVTVDTKGYSTYWLRIAKTAENLVRFFDEISFVYCDKKALLAWQWSKYLKAYIHAAKTRTELVLAKSEDETYVELGAKLGVTRGAAYRLHKDILAGSLATAGHGFPHFKEWMAERWIEELGLLRINVVKKQDRVERRTVWNLRVSSHDHSYLLASGANNFNSFETMSGRVYYPFDRHQHVSPKVVFNPSLPIWVGVDFNIDPMSAAIIQPQTNGQLWIVDEIFLHNSNTEEMCEELERRYWRYMKQITIYPDPAGGARQHARGESDLDIFRQKGFKRIKFRKKHPFVADRVNSVNRMLRSADGNIRIMVGTGCRNVIESLEQTLYKAGSRDIDKAAGMEHITDALGYPVELEFPTRQIVIAGRSL